MLIGEAPGRDEDAQGIAFVGRSGRLLDAMLEEAGWNPTSEIIIANVVKCRPPDNRPPQQKEVNECLPFLRKQIELLKPQQIALLGATAVKHLLGDKRPMNQLVGEFLTSESYPDQKFTVLFHPAFILRSPTRRGEMVGWLKNLRRQRTSSR